MRGTIVCIVVVAGLVASCDDAEEEGQAVSSADPITEATEAATAWVALVDEGRWGQSWDGACEYFRGAVPKETWMGQIQGVRGPLGALRSRERISAEPASSLPGAPDGDYVVIQFRTSFENKASAVETITPMRDPDGTYRVSGYYIR
jgi:hypothetical protein